MTSSPHPIPKSSSRSSIFCRPEAARPTWRNSSRKKRGAGPRSSAARESSRSEASRRSRASGPSRNDVGRKLVLDERNPVAQIELALLEPLNLEQVRSRCVLQGQDGHVQVAVLLMQARQLLPQVAFFLLGHCHRWFAGRPAMSPPAPKRKLSRFAALHSSQDRVLLMQIGIAAVHNRNRGRLGAGLM